MYNPPMSTPLLALDCPKCGAQLGSPTAGGSYVCAHCGEQSRAKVEVQVQRVIGAQQQFNAIATQKEIDERRREFERVAAVDKAFLEQRDGRRVRDDAAAKSTKVVIGVVIAVVVGLLLLVAAAVVGALFYASSAGGR